MSTNISGLEVCTSLPLLQAKEVLYSRPCSVVIASIPTSNDVISASKSRIPISLILPDLVRLVEARPKVTLELYFSGVINVLNTLSCPTLGGQNRMFGGEDSLVYMKTNTTHWAPSKSCPKVIARKSTGRTCFQLL